MAGYGRHGKLGVGFRTAGYGRHRSQWVKRFHEAGVTQIRPHKFKKTKKCRRIIGYDTNVLYLSTMLRDMPGGKGEVKKYTGQEGIERVKDSKWFGFAEVDIGIPQKLWMKFEEMPPFFFTRQIPEQAVPQHMKDYMERTGKKRGNEKSWLGACEQKSCCCMRHFCGGA